MRICFQDKCDEYWPEPGTTTTYGHVTVNSKEEEERADFVIRTFILKVKTVKTKMELADLDFPQESNLLSDYKNETIGTDPLTLFHFHRAICVRSHVLCQRVILLCCCLISTSICQT